MTRLAGFMVLLDVSIVNVALPSIERGLGASPVTVQWVVSGYGHRHRRAGRHLLRRAQPDRTRQAYLRWRNTNARHPDVLAAQRRERARIRSERHQRWGGPYPKAA